MKKSDEKSKKPYQSNESYAIMILHSLLQMRRGDRRETI